MSANNSEEKHEESKKTMAFVERDLYLKPLLRSKQQEDILEKGLIAAMENIKLDSNLWREVVHEYKEMTIKRYFLKKRLITSFKKF